MKEETSEIIDLSRENVVITKKDNGEMKAKEGIIYNDMYHSKWRFVFIFFCCMCLIGSYFCYDNPAPLEKQLELPVNEGGMGFSDFQYNLLYSFYSIPNFILPLFGGIFIDKYIGQRGGMIMFTLILAIGQFFFALSTTIVKKSISAGQNLMLGSRFIFGLGGENLLVAEGSFVGHWFKGQELSMAYGIDLCGSRLASVFNDNIQPYFFDATGNSLQFGYWFGFGICLFSFVCSCVLAYLDSKAEQSCHKLTSKEEAIEVNLRDIKKFKMEYWLININCFSIYMSIFSFQNVASDLYQSRFRVDEQMAGLLLGLPYLISAFLTPIVGYAIDKVGLKSIFMLMSSCLIAFAHLTLAFLPQIQEGGSPSYRCVLSIILLGIAYCFFATTYMPSISFCVSKRLLGTAFGINGCLLNIGLGIGPVLVAWIYQSTIKYKYGFFGVNILCCFEALIGLICGYYLFWIDYKKGQVLFSSDSLKMQNYCLDKGIIEGFTEEEPKKIQALLIN